MASGSKLVIFDCDGTLVDSQHVILEAVRQTFSKSGLPALADNEIRSVIGLSPYEAMQRMVPEGDEEQHRDLETVFKQTFYRLRVELAPEPDPLFDGTRDALELLNNEGYLLGVATGNSQRGLSRVIEEHDLHGLFVTLQTADGHPSKPHPSMIHKAASDAGADMADTVMVGDTSFDILMAKNAGTHALGVEWGYHGSEELRLAGARHVASAFSEIPALVDAWIGKP